LSEAELKRLRWRCRRGMKELDILLVRWLELRWAAADAGQRAAFEALLESEDDRLWYWFTAKERPPAGAIGSLVDEIRADAGL
jgi:antitoxin CptB